ncbi:MerR family transcriptional regulator [Solibacillus sp. FSL H8-0523]|uniref:MerR family transcriptional regulator n=1 Tax=Solibacillus sp. FSL H8-0523 TaxID=2954511 RepID=UPI003100C377
MNTKDVMKMYSIGQFAKKTGLTIRALRYYDEKGLVTPAQLSEGGQRLYNDANILTVQKIVTYKYLDFTIEEIKALLMEETPLIDSLQQQKHLLQQKKQQLEKVIASIDTAIQIHEKINVTEPTIFLLVLNSLLTEEQQREYLAAFLPKATIDKMYQLLEADLVELNRQYIEVAYAIKVAYREQANDEELFALFQRFLNIIPKDIQIEIAQAFAEVNIEQLDDLLFPSPFTKEEEEWVTTQMERLQVSEVEFDEETTC